MAHFDNAPAAPISPHGGGVTSRAAAAAQADSDRRAASMMEADKISRAMQDHVSPEVAGEATAKTRDTAATMPSLPDAQLRLAFYQASNGDLDAAKAAYEWAIGADSFALDAEL